MKVLWIVNIMFPYPSKMLGREKSVFGGWLNGLFNELKNSNEIELGILSTYDGKNLKKYNDGLVQYYLLPYKNDFKYDESCSTFCNDIINEFKPDIVHFHGSEYPFSSVFLNNTHGYISILSIQGLISICSKYYYSSISKKDIIKNITLRDILKFDTLFQAKNKFSKRGKYEINLIKNVDYIIGRTSWDRANTYNISNKNNYLFCNESLREVFYKSRWNIENIKRHSIFVSQASYPIKGFHHVIKACNILKIKYPDIEVNVAGADIINKGYKISGYGKYIKNMIKRYNLTQNIHFVGLLDEKEICKYMLKSNVFVSASSIENSSNSVGEAMLIGMPIVSSYVGGIGDIIKDKDEGLLYQYEEYAMLANYIDNIFSSDELAINLGNNAHKHAIITHDRSNNVKNMLQIYKKIQKKEK